MTRANAAREKAARLAAMRHAPVVDPEQEQEHPAQEPALFRSSSRRPAVERVRPIKVSLELAPELHAEFVRWCMDAARELGRGRVNSTEPLRVLVRRLLADEELSRVVMEALRREVK